MTSFSQAEARANRLLVEAEEAYTPAAFARALESVEALDPSRPLTIFRRASIMHALAELRGDLALLDQAIAEDERAYASGELPPEVARLMPELIEDCEDQRREALER